MPPTKDRITFPTDKSLLILIGNGKNLLALYKWLLNKYAKPGDKILDTHLGSVAQ
jgi:hypothetical protein